MSQNLSKVASRALHRHHLTQVLTQHLITTHTHMRNRLSQKFYDTYYISI